MFTVDSLLGIAAEAENRVQSGLGNASEARREMDMAMLAAEWLETNGGAAPYVGSFGEVKIKKGDRVKIKAGADITSTSKRLVRTLARAYTVDVFDVHAGYIHVHLGYNHRRDAVRNPQVCWVGTGGYWCYTDLANVEKV